MVPPSRSARPPAGPTAHGSFASSSTARITERPGGVGQEQPLRWFAPVCWLSPVPACAIRGTSIIFRNKKSVNVPPDGQHQSELGNHRRLGDGMQERIARLDDALIDHVCQPIVDRLSTAMTVDCFRLARLCNDAASFAWLLSQASRVSDALATNNVSLAGAQGALMIIGLAALATLRRVFDGKQGSRSSTGARANPLRAAMFLHRLSCLVWVGAQLLGTVPGPAAFADILTICVGLMTTASVYVGACSTPPPVRRSRFSRVWAWRLAAIRQA
jgi:hypothetical protein